MHYKILPTKEFSKDFKKLGKKNQLQIKKKVEKAAENPGRYKRLHYDLSGSNRLRVGKIRVIFSYDEVRKELYLEKIVLRHRYKN